MKYLITLFTVLLVIAGIVYADVDGNQYFKQNKIISFSSIAGPDTTAAVKITDEVNWPSTVGVTARVDDVNDDSDSTVTIDLLVSQDGTHWAPLVTKILSGKNSPATGHTALSGGAGGVALSSDQLTGFKYFAIGVAGNDSVDITYCKARIGE